MKSEVPLSDDQHAALAQWCEANKNSGHTLRTTSPGLTFSGVAGRLRTNEFVNKVTHTKLLDGAVVHRRCHGS